MALIAQPDWLPEPLRQGYGFQHVSPMLRSTFVSGRSINRRAYTATPTSLELRWLMEDMRCSLFEKWFQEVLKDGTAWFALRLRSPLGMDHHKCRFTDIYDGPTLSEGNLWSIVAPVEMYLRPLAPDGWIEAPGIVLGAGLVDIAANREWPEA